MAHAERNIDEPGPCAIDDCEHEAPGGYDLCEECEDHYEFCTVCDAWVPDGAGEHCRHIYWSNRRGYFAGCGSSHGPDDDDDRAGVHAVCRVLGEARATRLRAAILSQHYWSQYQGPLIGQTWLTFEIGGRWIDGKGFDPAVGPTCPDTPASGYLCHKEDIGRVLTDYARDLDDEEDAGPGFADGIGWLVSLYPGDSTPAERLTADWIEEWLANLAGFAFVRATSEGA